MLFVKHTIHLLTYHHDFLYINRQHFLYNDKFKRKEMRETTRTRITHNKRWVGIILIIFDGICPFDYSVEVHMAKVKRNST